MKKFFVFFLLTTIILSFSFTYFRTPDVLLYPNRTISFYSNETVSVRVYKFDITKEIFEKDLKNGKSVRFLLEKSNENVFSIILPQSPGAYYVILEGQDKYVSNLFFLTNYEAFVASNDKEFYFSVYDLKEGKFVNRLFYFDDDFLRSITGPVFKADIEKYKGKVFFYENNVVFISRYSAYNPYSEKKVLVFSDKPIYKPGDVLRFRVNLFKREGSKYVPYSSKILVHLRDPFSNEIFSQEFNTDDFGGVSFEYKTTDEIITGNYVLTIEEKGKALGYHYFLLQDYVKPTYTIELTPSATQSIVGQTVNVKLSARYLNGDPVKMAQVLFYAFRDGRLINKTKAVTDENGQALYGLYLKEGGYYRIQSLVVDDSGRQYEKQVFIDAKKDNVSIDAKINNNKLNLYITDLSGTPLNGVALIKINEKEEYVTVLDGKSFLNLPKDTWYVEVQFGKERKLVFKRYRESNAGILTVDRDSIEPGGKVKITVEPKDDVGVLVAGGTNIDVFKIIDNKLESVEISIPKEEISDGYFISYYGLKFNDNIKINILHDRVRKLEIKTNKDVYKPGEIAKVSFKDSKSLKVVSIADEGLYLLSDRGSVINDLYPRLYYSTFEVYKSSKYIYLDYLSRFENEKEKHIFASSKESEEKNIREYFPETLYWSPNLFEENLTLKVPDSITKWRVLAYEISSDYISEGSATFVVTKQFEVKLFVPEFLTNNDQPDCVIYVKNYTGKSGKVEVKLNVKNATSTFESGVFNIERDLRIPFSLKGVSGKNVDLILEASLNDEHDAIKIKVPVNAAYIEKVSSKVLRIKDKMEFEKDVDIKVINNLKDLLAESIENLITYPYGCTEQTMSSFYPALVAKKILERKDIDDIVLKGLQRILKLQHRDGGWGWWSNDKSDVYMTSYVLEGLYYAKQNGYYFPQVSLDEAIDYLKKQELNGYAVFVLKLYGEEVDFKSKNIIDEIFTTPEKVLKYAKVGENFAYIESNGFYSSVYLTSYALRLLSLEEKYPDLREKMVNYLLSKKNGPFWYSTKDTAASILAILESDSFKDIKSDITVKSEGGKVIVSGEGFIEVKQTERIEKEDQYHGIKLKTEIFKRYEFLFDGEYIDAFLPVESSWIPISMELFDSTLVQISKVPREISMLLNEGTPLSFENGKLVVEGPFKFVGNEYSFDKGYYEIQFVENDNFEIQKGDFLKTQITIDGTGEYLVVEEYLPACAQVNKYYYEKTPEYYSKFSYRWYEDNNIWYSYRDVKKDRVAFFIRYLTPGKLTYYWRVTSSGKYIKKPTYVYNMYYEDTYAISHIDTFVIK